MREKTQGKGRQQPLTVKISHRNKKNETKSIDL